MIRGLLIRTLLIKTFQTVSMHLSLTKLHKEQQYNIAFQKSVFLGFTQYFAYSKKFFLVIYIYIYIYTPVLKALFKKFLVNICGKIRRGHTVLARPKMQEKQDFLKKKFSFSVEKDFIFCFHIDRQVNENQRVRNYSTFNATSSFMRSKQSSGYYLVS